MLQSPCSRRNTSKYMFKVPLGAMKVFSDQFLCRSLLVHVLTKVTAKELMHQFVKRRQTVAYIWQDQLIFTRDGRHSLACFLRTENPPWVLVSDAVKTLQKEWTFGLWGSGRHGSWLVGSACYSQLKPTWVEYYNIQHKSPKNEKWSFNFLLRLLRASK